MNLAQTISGILDSDPDVTYKLDHEGRFTELSESAQSFLGYDRAELMGKSAFELIHPDDVEAARAGIAEAVSRRDEEVRTVETRLIDKEGIVRDFELHRRLVFEAGQLVGFEGIARDVTEHKALEERLRRLVELASGCTARSSTTHRTPSPSTTRTGGISSRIRRTKSCWGTRTRS